MTTFNVLYSALYHDSGYPFDALADKVATARQPEDLKSLDSALVVWGGADINPAYYRHPLHRTTYPGGMRDRLEWALMNAAKDKGIPIIGVCRGAQMLCALAGGWLIQDVGGHAGPRHDVTTHDGQTFQVNSLHHQMMAGLGTVEHELVAWREGREGAPYGYMDNRIYVPPAEFKEPEFVYFPRVYGYAVQWHPEMMGRDSDATRYVLDYIKQKELAKGSYATAEVQL